MLIHSPITDVFRGFACENAAYGFGIHQANASAHCSQGPHMPPIGPNVFEIMWDPAKIQFTSGTSAERDDSLATIGGQRMPS
jgi:hypothetical protein